MNNMTELDKLEAYLKEKGIKYKRADEAKLSSMERKKR